MIDLYTTQISFLIFEAVFCLLAALVYSISRDPLRIRKSEIYRVGGDEFMIIASDTSLPDFEKLNQTLQENCERPNRAHFAVGACHSEKVDNIRKAMQRADARMYEVKEEYYQRHPEYEWHKKPV